MRCLALIAVTLLCPSLSDRLYARNFERTPVESTAQGHLRWGECRLDADPDVPGAVKWPILCVRPKVSGQVLLREDDGSQNKYLNYGSVYTGLHLVRLVSLHG